MKLRAPFVSQQLLFLLSFGLLALAGVRAQDTVIKQDNSAVQAKVVGVSGSTLQLQMGPAVVGIPLAGVKEVRMAAPPEYTSAIQAFEAKDYRKVLSVLGPLTAKFKGVPAEWTQQATAMIGDAYVEINDLTRAEGAYKEFQRLYPTSALADIGIAAVALARKDFATAKAKLEPVAEKALKEKNVPRALAIAYSKAFYLLGQAKEAEGNLSGALEDYLRTVTLFYHDRATVALAQEKADALRKAHRDLIVP